MIIASACASIPHDLSMFEPRTLCLNEHFTRQIFSRQSRFKCPNQKIASKDFCTSQYKNSTLQVHKHGQYFYDIRGKLMLLKQRVAVKH